MGHRLDALLRPRSIAVVGATRRPGSVGLQTVQNLVRGDFGGSLYAVNPRYEEVCGVACHPSLDALPEPVEHVVFAVGDASIESALDEAIAHGASAVTIMSSLVLSEDTNPPLRERIAAKVRGAGLLVCGGNGMGFYNFRDRIWACGFDTRAHSDRGDVTLISHSGSGMSGILDVDERLRFNLAVSTGQELAVTMDEYLDFALELPDTKVVGLFMETARNPPGLIAAFEKANAKGVPIVAIKVGRTELAARLTVSHSGALAGTDTSFAALFERYGVQRVADMDELATALIMFAQPHPVGPGGLVSIHDSGGERQLAIDLASEVGVPYAQLEEATLDALGELLDPGLPAVNPLDAWSAGGSGYHRVMEDCFAALLGDPAAAMGAVIHDRAPFGRLYPGYADYLRKGHLVTGKPVFLVASRQGTGSDPLAVSLTHEGFPVLDGVRQFLRGARCLLDYRDFRARAPARPPVAPAGAADKWRGALAGRGMLSEAEGLELLRDFGLPANRCTLAESEADAVQAARDLGFPVALKAAGPGLAHKSDVGGVELGLADEREVATAYRALSARLGPRTLVAPMIEGGVEMVLGLVRDEQFGSVVMLGFGGIHAELLRDVVFELAPFDAATARRAVDRLRMRTILDGARGAPAADVAAYCDAAARLSALARALDGLIEEIDINPIIVRPEGCVAVDCLVNGVG